MNVFTVINNVVTQINIPVLTGNRKHSFQMYESTTIRTENGLVTIFKTRTRAEAWIQARKDLGIN